MRALIRKNLTIRPSQIAGYGVFAAEEIKAGETIEEAYALPGNRGKTFSNYYFNLAGIPYLALGYGSIYNHAEDFNARTSFESSSKVIIFTATRDIQPDEEIFIHYGDNWFKDRQMRAYSKRPSKDYLLLCCRVACVLSILYILMHLTLF